MRKQEQRAPEPVYVSPYIKLLLKSVGNNVTVVIHKNLWGLGKFKSPICDPATGCGRAS